MILLQPCQMSSKTLVKTKLNKLMITTVSSMITRVSIPSVRQVEPEMESVEHQELMGEKETKLLQLLLKGKLLLGQLPKLWMFHTNKTSLEQI